MEGLENERNKLLRRVLGGDVVMTNNDWLDEIFAGWSCFYKDDKIVDFESRTLKQQILDHISNNYIERNKHLNPIKLKILEFAKDYNLNDYSYFRLSKLLKVDHPYKVQFAIKQLIKHGYLDFNKQLKEPLE